MSANDKQVAGTHYEAVYQHWDMACDVDMHCLHYAATKYIFRWRKKNGVQDLHKAIHYVEKSTERRVCRLARHDHVFVEEFLTSNKVPMKEAFAIRSILCANYDQALLTLNSIIQEEESASYEAGPGYVNQ